MEGEDGKRGEIARNKATKKGKVKEVKISEKETEKSAFPYKTSLEPE